jgi:hypothetical protein
VREPFPMLSPIKNGGEIQYTKKKKKQTNKQTNKNMNYAKIEPNNFS